MNAELLLESLDRHFMAGCTRLTTGQLAQHKKSGTCLACRFLAASTAGTLAAAAAGPGTDGGTT